jgi:hypothetical protein
MVLVISDADTLDPQNAAWDPIFANLLFQGHSCANVNNFGLLCQTKFEFVNAEE